MPSALVPLANITLGSSASTVTFSSISGSYRDLMFVIGGSSAGSTNVTMRFNSDSGTNYNMVWATGYGSTTTSGSSANNSLLYTNAGASFQSGKATEIINIMDYSATDKHKTVLSRTSASDNGVEMNAARWASTAAITTVAFTGAGSYDVGTTFALYGVSA